MISYASITKVLGRKESHYLLQALTHSKQHKVGEPSPVQFPAL